MGRLAAEAAQQLPVLRAAAMEGEQPRARRRTPLWHGWGQTAEGYQWQGLTRRSDRGAGVRVLGAAVGALLVAVVLVGRDTFVAFQRCTCARGEQR